MKGKSETIFKRKLRYGCYHYSILSNHYIGTELDMGINTKTNMNLSPEYYYDRIYELGFGGKTYEGPPYRTLNWEKLLTMLGEKNPPECYFCAVNRHIDVYTPKNHETHQGVAAVNLKNLVEYLEKLK